MKKLSANQLLKNMRDKVTEYDNTHCYTCDICGRDVFANERICTNCYNDLPWNDKNVCPFCGRRVEESGVCLDCKGKRICLDKAFSCFTYEREAARLILRFKRGEKYLYRTLADFLEKKIPEVPEVDFITFVPMTEKAEKKRGYNQCRLLAEELSRRSGIALFSSLEKQRETKAQKTLGRQERSKNLKGCFRLTERKPVKEKRILIVDDTLTTGATAEELADCFYRADAKQVFLLTVASVQKKSPYGNPPETDKKNWLERLKGLFTKKR